MKEDSKEKGIDGIDVKRNLKIKDVVIKGNQDRDGGSKYGGGGGKDICVFFFKFINIYA